MITWKQEENELADERFALAKERLCDILTEESVNEPYLGYFRETAKFLLELTNIGTREEADISMTSLQQENKMLYEDILPENYGISYANPEYAVQKFGEEYGTLLSFLYTEMRGGIAYAYEGRLSYLTILSELFIEIYNNFEEQMPDVKELKNVIYWYVSDYCDVFYADRIREQILPQYSFAAEHVKTCSLNDLRYLYAYGEYVSENEIRMAEFINALPQETIAKMADVYTEGYRMGFVNGNKPLHKKSTVEIRFPIGFERVVKRAMENFEKMGLQTTILRPGVSVLTKKGVHKIGYSGTSANKQYDYDHREDLGLILDKRFVERKLDVAKNVYEQYKEAAEKYAGPAVIETFGEEPFAPETNPYAIVFTKKQKELSVRGDSKMSQITNHYIKGEERSFTIISYPVPEIGEKFEEIFAEVIKINTLDADVYEKVQQTLIDALDQGEYVHILGKDENKTDLKVQLYRLSNPDKETIFENCVADVNIPVGEVFTSPVLEGTNGTLHVSKVYLNELLYKNLAMEFVDGKIVSYNCTNFEKEEDNKKYIEDNILYNHPTLPLGEFAIGTNTTAYVAAKKYDIHDKMTILIAEKMGPHFAVGDTCYSWSEDTKVYNPNGKEIVARDNSVSILRKTDLASAYFQCHTDITIPYEEIAEICVVTADRKKIVLLKDGRFVLKGTEVLNEPFEEM